MTRRQPIRIVTPHHMVPLPDGKLPEFDPSPQVPPGESPDPVDGFDDINMDDDVPFIEQVAQARYTTSTWHFGGQPHRWIELFGGKTLQFFSYHPDIFSFRDKWYYNTVENELYSKFMWWQAIEADISEYYAPDNLPITSMAVNKVKEKSSGRIIEAFPSNPDPYNYHDDYCYNIITQNIYRKRANWQRYGNIFTMGRYEKYINGKFTDPEYPTFYRFSVVSPNEITVGVPFEASVQATQISNEEPWTEYVPNDVVDIFLDPSTSNNYEVSPTEIDNTGWVNGEKSISLQISISTTEPPQHPVHTILVFRDKYLNMVGGDNISILPP